VILLFSFANNAPLRIGLDFDLQRQTQDACSLHDFAQWVGMFGLPGKVQGIMNRKQQPPAFLFFKLDSVQGGGIEYVGNRTLNPPRQDLPPVA